MMKKTFILIVCITMVMSCKEKENILSETEIDQIVNTITNPEQLYDIALSMRFTRNDEQYSALEYSKNDTVVLYVENFESDDISYVRQTYYYHKKPIFINEFGYKYINNEEKEYQKKIYINNGRVTAAYEGFYENLEDTIPNFQHIETDLSQINFQKPREAVNQEGDFEMIFGEFLILESQSYLILENKKSKYNVALYITEGDQTLNALFERPEEFKGKTVFVLHEFSNDSGIERMHYKGGTIIEKL